jgi:hypothetical protein
MLIETSMITITPSESPSVHKAEQQGVQAPFYRPISTSILTTLDKETYVFFPPFFALITAGGTNGKTTAENSAAAENARSIKDAVELYPCGCAIERMFRMVKTARIVVYIYDIFCSM